MTIKIKTDDNIGSKELKFPMVTVISEKLLRFSPDLTRLELHLSDKNGNREGLKVKKCLLKARLDGRRPITVINRSHSHEHAFNGALAKLTSSLDRAIGF